MRKILIPAGKDEPGGKLGVIISGQQYRTEQEGALSAESSIDSRRIVD